MQQTECNTLYTIGHSNQSAEELGNLLRTYEIDVVVDVRSSPYSRWAPQFNKDTLQQYLRSLGIRYLYLGKELGGRPNPKNRPDLYDEEGRALYYRMAGEEAFLSGLGRLLDGIERYRVAVMCSEENPTDCHRRLLIGKSLTDRECVRLEHIRRDGTADSELSVPLASETAPIQQTMFDDTGKTGDTNPWRSTQSVLPGSRQSSFSTS